MNSRIFFLLTALAAVAPVMAKPDTPAMATVTEAELPAEFRRAAPFIQNQVCGELMMSMTRVSKNLFEQTGNTKVKEAAVLTGTRAMVFAKANAALTPAERDQARDLARRLEQGVSEQAPSIKPFIYCEQRAQRWLKEGVVTDADYRLAEQDVRRSLDELSAKPKR